MNTGVSFDRVFTPAIAERKLTDETQERGEWSHQQIEDSINDDFESDYLDDILQETAIRRQEKDLHQLEEYEQRQKVLIDQMNDEFHYIDEVLQQSFRRHNEEGGSGESGPNQTIVEDEKEGPDSVDNISALNDEFDRFDEVLENEIRRHEEELHRQEEYEHQQENERRQRDSASWMTNTQWFFDYLREIFMPMASVIEYEHNEKHIAKYTLKTLEDLHQSQEWKSMIALWCQEGNDKRQFSGNICEDSNVADDVPSSYTLYHVTKDGYFSGFMLLKHLQDSTDSVEILDGGDNELLAEIVDLLKDSVSLISVNALLAPENVVFWWNLGFKPQDKVLKHLMSVQSKRFPDQDFSKIFKAQKVVQESERLKFVWSASASPDNEYIDMAPLTKEFESFLDEHAEDIRKILLSKYSEKEFRLQFHPDRCIISSQSIHKLFDNLGTTAVGRPIVTDALGPLGCKAIYQKFSHIFKESESGGGGLSNPRRSSRQSMPNTRYYNNDYEV